MLRRHGVWGEDVLLADPDLRGRNFPRAVSYLEVYYIGRDELLRIARCFSDAWFRLRRRIVFLAIQRYTVLLSKTLAIKKRAAARGHSPSRRGSTQDTKMMSFIMNEIADADKEPSSERRNYVKVVASDRRGVDRIDAVLNAIGALRSEVGTLTGNMSALQSQADRQQEMLHTQQEMLRTQQEMLLSLRNEVQSSSNGA